MKLSSKQLRFILLGFCLLWMAVIFEFSASYATDSSNQSGSLVNLISSFFGGEMSTLGMNALEVAVRKAAHIVEFGILGALWYGFFYVSPSGRFKPTTSAFTVSVLYAVSDEVHQYFVPGRAARLYDVGFDTLGIVLGIIIVIYVIKRRKNGSKNSQFS